MNAPTLALHGRLAAEVLRMVADPAVDWAGAAEAAELAGDERMFALFDTLDSLGRWGRQFANTGTVAEAENPPSPGDSPEGPSDDRAT